MFARPSNSQWLVRCTVFTCCCAWFAIGCESPGRDEQDAMDDTLSVVDTVIDGGQDTALHFDVDPDAAVKVDLLAGGDTVPLSQLADAIAKWECDRILACGCTNAQQRTPDATSCIAQIAPAIAKTWSNGGLVARAELIPVCLAALESSSAPCAIAKLTDVTPCLAALRWPGKSGDTCGGNGPFLCADGGLCEQGKCTGSHLGMTAIGQPCSNPFVCGDAACIKNAAGKGTCTVPAAIGGACTAPTDCAAPAICASGHCAAQSPLDGTCSAPMQCTPGLTCDFDSKCKKPTTCTPGQVCGNGGVCLGEIHATCAARLGVGSACAADGECIDGAFCDSTTKTCATLPKVGQTCGNGVWCAPGLGCETGKTTCQTLAKAGQSCMLGPNGATLCAAGSLCIGTSAPVCGTPPGLGEPCAAGMTCSDADIDGDGKKGDLSCNIDKGMTCTAKGGIDTVCHAPDACKDGLYCDTTTTKCATTIAAGGSCANDLECGANAACVPNASGKLMCTSIPGAGQTCLDKCTNGLYCAVTTNTATCAPPICAELYSGK